MNERRTDGGRLVMVATPIGNLGDLSPRAAQALTSADVVAAEDTRRTGRLLQHIRESRSHDPGSTRSAADEERRPRLISYHEHNEAARGPELLGLVEAGSVVAAVSDAGTPGVADPGYRLVSAAVAMGLEVTAIPGPSAVLQALLLSGLGTDRFTFEGFLPRKKGARERHLAGLAADPRTMVFYVAPHRAAEELQAMVEAFGATRPAALARELTKRHEEVWHGTLDELSSRTAEGVRGEVTVVVAGAGDTGDAAGITDAELVAQVRHLVSEGRSRRDAVALVAAAAGVSRRRLYSAAIAADTGTAQK